MRFCCDLDCFRCPFPDCLVDGLTDDFSERFDVLVLEERKGSMQRSSSLNRYYLAHREEAIERSKQYYRKHRQECIEYQKQRYRENRERLLEYQKARYHLRKLKGG